MRVFAIVTFLFALLLTGAAQAQIVSAQSGEWRQGATWTGGVVPTMTDDVVISSGHTVSVDDATSECRSLSFAANDANIDMNANSRLTIYGDFTLASTTHNAFAGGWSATDARVVFAGAGDQLISGFSTSTAGSTSFRDLIVNKPAGTVATAGGGQRIGVQETIELISGTFLLGADDDLEERSASTGAMYSTPQHDLDITVQADGAFVLADGTGSHWIRSGLNSHPIGAVVVYGQVDLYDASSSDISFSSITVKDGGELKLGTGLTSSGPALNSGPIVVESGGTLLCVTTSNIWFVSDGLPEHPDASVEIQDGGTFEISSGSVVFPNVYTDNGRVRYTRNFTSSDQTIADRDYNRVEFSFPSDGSRYKFWDLTAGRVVADSLTTNNKANLVLTASSPQTLTVNNTIRLTSGTLDNTDADVTLMVGDGATISRATGVMMAAPAFAGGVNLRYTSSVETMTTGPEVPTDPATLNNMEVIASAGIELGSDVQINGTLLVGGAINTAGFLMTLGGSAVIDETGGTIVQGSVDATRVLASSTPESFGSLGVVINALGGAPGVTHVLRVTGVPQDLGGGVYGVARYFDINPTGNSGLNAGLVFSYDESELNGIPEAGLSLYSSDDGGATWVERGGTVDELANTVTLAGIDAFSRWTLGVENTPPVCTVPGNQDILQCDPTQICLPVSCTDDRDPAPVITVSAGPGEIVGGNWCYTPTGNAFFDVTIHCEDAYGNFCEGSFHVTITMNSAPVITNCPTADLAAHWGQPFTYDLNATDANAGQVISYSLCGNAPAGMTINASTGVINWTPTAAQICGGEFCVIAKDDACGDADTCTMQVNVVNSPPVITCPDDMAVCSGYAFETVITATDADNGPFGPWFFIVSGPVGVEVDPNTGVVSWDEPIPGSNEICVLATDSAAVCEYSPDNADTCCFNLDIKALDVVIEHVPEQIQGQIATVGIDFLRQGVNWPISGFDFLVQYDPSALSFLGAEAGSFITDCAWEYFTYRFGANGNCGPNACPSGVLRVTAMAETTGGNVANHPDCFTNDGLPSPGPGSTTSTELVELSFLVSNDRTYECQFVPIRFVWYDCADNSMSSIFGDTLFISNNVFEYAGELGEPPVSQWTDITGLDLSFPTVTGASAPECNTSLKAEPVRCAGFYHGGIELVCADSIDAPGDINLNGIAYEVADAVMFTNYFIIGPAAFAPHFDGSAAASDCNRDGLPLTVADLVYEIRVVIGDALPYAKQSAVVGSYSHVDGIIAVSDGLQISGAALVVEGQVTPELMVSGMNLAYQFDGENTRIVVTPTLDAATIGSFTGSFLRGVSHRIVSIELATPDGVPVVAKNVPTTYSLQQNFPNPFNPTTTIEFALPTAGLFEVTIYNIRGQVVETYRGRTDAPGVFRYEWNASDLASGVYLYRLTADDYSATRKMLLLK